MDIPIKIHGGTTRGSVSLCRTCRSATVVRGHNNEEMVRCSLLECNMNFKVAECSDYRDRNKPLLYEMEEIAWRVVTKGSRALGFVNPTEFKKREREER